MCVCVCICLLFQARSLVSDKDKTKYLCNLHLVAGELNSEKLKQGDTYYTLTGKGSEATIGEVVVT